MGHQEESSCSYRGPECGSQHPCWVTHNPLMPSSDHHGYPHTCTHTYAQIKICLFLLNVGQNSYLLPATPNRHFQGLTHKGDKHMWVTDLQHSRRVSLPIILLGCSPGAMMQSSSGQMSCNHLLNTPIQVPATDLPWRFITQALSLLCSLYQTGVLVLCPSSPLSYDFLDPKANFHHYLSTPCRRNYSIIEQGLLRLSQTIQKNLNSGLDGTPFVTTHFPQLVKVLIS